MRWWWSEWPGRAAEPVRPRVTHAAEAAHMVQAGVPAGLGSARVAMGALRHWEAVERAATSGPLHKMKRRAQRGLSPDLVWATARAARDLGRKPEEVWAEALRNWLTTQDGASASAPAPRTLVARRQQVWCDIDETLQALRAS